MPIISTIGRKSVSVTVLLAVIYAALLVGSVSMIYPFLIMLSGSTKSGVDIRRTDVVPRFLYDDTELYRKHIEGLFNESLEAMKTAYNSDATSFETVRPPAAPNRRLADEWLEFIRSTPLPPYAFSCGYLSASVSRTTPGNLRRIREELSARFRGSITAMNEALGSDFANWNSLFILPENYLLRQSMPSELPFARAFEDFKKGLDKQDLYFFSAEGCFKKLYLQMQYTRDIHEYNRTHSTDYSSWADIHLSRRLPDGTEAEKYDWNHFVRNNLNLLWIRADPGAGPYFWEFLAAKYKKIDALNRRYKTDYTSFEGIPLIHEPPLSGLALSDWDSVISGWTDPETGRQHIIPPEFLSIHSVDFLFRDFLEKKFGTLDKLNHAVGSSFADFAQILPPQQDAHFLHFLEIRRALRWEFATRNYKTALDYLLFHGRGIVNTSIYCVLAVLVALLVNPMAAYALSRFRLRGTYKILLFLLLTMAFPVMVTQIPVFLMLRQFHLLNTFAALILPSLASGYSIFLLKGFFDSLPRELYESAELDGASEWILFWQITMSLSKPILAVIALQAFTAAYANFMYALLICQDERMWTLMVWLYQLQDRSGPAVIYASLIVAAIPTFIIFILCQKIIMRGIVIPVEK